MRVKRALSWAKKKCMLRLREVREAQGWTMQAVCAAMEISLATLHGWESGRIDVPVSRLYELALLYQVPVTALFPDPLP